MNTTMPMRATLRWLQRLFVVLATVTIVVALAEFFMTLLQPRPLPKWRYTNQYICRERPGNVNLVLTAEAGLPGVARKHRFTTNSYGFRGDPLNVPKPAGEFRIFVVGGSTTECSIIDDGDEIAAVVQRDLADHTPPSRTIRVYNAGISSAASDDHVAMIGHRLVHLEPDMVVVFSGINDLVMRSMTDFNDYLHYKRPAITLEKLRREQEPWLVRQFSKLRVGQLWARFRPRSARQIRGERDTVRRKIELQRAHPEVDDVPRTDPTSYGNNLKTIIGMAQAHGFQLVFITQQTTWNSSVDPDASSWHWMRCRSPSNVWWNRDYKTFREDLMDEAVESLNDEMRDLARQFSVPLYDLPKHVPKSLEYFYDDCHFNTKGSRTAGQGFAAFLRDEGIVPQE